MKQLVTFSLIVLGLMGGLGLWPFTPANAALITHQFRGTVDEVAPSLYTPSGSGANGFDLGLQLTGKYTFESTTTGYGPTPPPFPNHPQLPPTTTALYPGLIRSADLTLGNHAAHFPPGGYSSAMVAFSNNGAAYLLDMEQTGNLVNGVSPFVFSFQLVDTTGTALSSIELPNSQPPSIGGFNSHRWSLLFFDGTAVKGSLTALQPVPLPSSGLLFGVALIALAAWRMRSIQNSL